MPQSWTPVPNLPHVFYATRTAPGGQYFIGFHCAVCADTSQKPCSNPGRTNYWVLVYASQHGHGKAPVLR